MCLLIICLLIFFRPLKGDYIAKKRTLTFDVKKQKKVKYKSQYIRCILRYTYTHIYKKVFTKAGRREMGFHLSFEGSYLKMIKNKMVTVMIMMKLAAVL